MLFSRVLEISVVNLLLPQDVIAFYLRYHCVSTVLIFPQYPFYELHLHTLYDIIEHDRFGLVSSSTPPIPRTPSLPLSETPEIPNSPLLELPDVPNFNPDCDAGESKALIGVPQILPTCFTPHLQEQAQEQLQSIWDTLARYQSHAVPSPGEEIRVTLDKEISPARVFFRPKIADPEVEEDFLNVQFGAIHLICSFSPASIIALLSAILLEQKVLLVCSNLHKVGIFMFIKLIPNSFLVVYNQFFHCFVHFVTVTLLYRYYPVIIEIFSALMPQ